MEWIPVSEQLPPRDKRPGRTDSLNVFVRTARGGFSIMFYDYAAELWYYPHTLNVAEVVQWATIEMQDK